MKDIVIEQKKFTMTQLKEMLKADFIGYEKEQRLLIASQKFGNDFDCVDEVAIRLHEMVCNAIKRQNKRTRLDSLLVVIINNNMNVSMGNCTGATPDGRNAYKYLSNANGAYNGRDKEGVTALMKSMTKLDTSIHAGANQNFKFSTDLFRDKEKVKALLNGFFALGGQQTNISVVNQKDLEDALVHPENHENLVVRVGGYTSRFINLDRKTQQEILMRTAY
jgi:pyruvate-formate lyase